VAIHARRQSAGAIGCIVMKAIDQLKDKHVLALARFIVGCERVLIPVRWRTRFSECAARNCFVPYVTPADQDQLREMVRRHDAAVVCCLRTVEIMQAANQVAAEWGESPVRLETMDGSPASVATH
jgi:hypothetical protein